MAGRNEKEALLGPGTVDALPEPDGKIQVVAIRPVPVIARIDLVVQRPESGVLVRVVPGQPEDVLHVVVKEPPERIRSASGIELLDLVITLGDLGIRAAKASSSHGQPIRLCLFANSETAGDSVLAMSSPLSIVTPSGRDASST